jgi:hypothetical protein
MSGKMFVIRVAAVAVGIALGNKLYNAYTQATTPKQTVNL